ncbi:MAG: SusE domain-containing protein [Parafilimonas sp.]|nr:SusE domain-containing protein [Parafilimonas sp.]
MNKLFYLIICSVLVFASCKKEETTAYFQGGTDPVLTATSNSGSNVINLDAADSTSPALHLSWTNPNYMFNYGVSSLSVNYLVEIDTSGSDFTNPKRAQLSISQATDTVLTEGKLNAYLTNSMGLDTSFAHQLEIRITSSINTSGNGAGTYLYSNVESFTAKPYFPPPAVTPPATGNLYIVGDATAGGWNNNDSPAPDGIGDQNFTQVSDKDYQITIYLTGDKEYKFIETPGSWTEQWSIGTEQSVGDPSTLDYTLKFNGANVRAPSASGNYLIDVNFQTGKVTLTKQ